MNTDIKGENILIVNLFRIYFILCIKQHMAIVVNKKNIAYFIMK